MSARDSAGDGGERRRIVRSGRQSNRDARHVDLGRLGRPGLEVMLDMVEHLVKTRNAVVVQADIRSATDAEIVVRISADA